MAIVSEGGKVSRTGKSAKRKGTSEEIAGPQPAKDQKPAKKAKAAKVDAPPPAEPKILGASKMVARSMASLVECYVARMTADQKTESTINGYRNDLQLAVHELGANTLVESLTPQRVSEYFNSDVVTLLKSGGSKSQLSIDKTRRVLRRTRPANPSGESEARRAISRG